MYFKSLGYDEYFSKFVTQKVAVSRKIFVKFYENTIYRDRIGFG